MKRVDALAALELIGSETNGLVTAAAAKNSGIAQTWLTRLSNAGHIERLRHGVYALPSAAGTSNQELRAVWLSLGGEPGQPNVVVADYSAAVLHGLGDLVSPSYQFLSRTKKQSAQRDLRIRQTAIKDTEIVWIDGLPVTSVSRTVQDLITQRIDDDHLRGVLESAIVIKGADETQIENAVGSGFLALGRPLEEARSLIAGIRAVVGAKPHGQLAFDSELREYLDTAIRAGIQSKLENRQDVFHGG